MGIIKNPKTFEEAVEQVFQEQKKLLISKQHDYGHSNITMTGEYGVLVRVSDKVSRLLNLLYQRVPKHESLEDSWRDILNYAAIALMLRRGTFTNPLKKDGVHKKKM